MQDILTQEEIDRLIMTTRQSSVEDEEEEEVVSDLYDFRKPNKFSKEHLRALQRIHEQFCRTYSGLMSAKLRARLDLKFHSIEQLSFGEFVRSLPNPSVLAVLAPTPLPGNVVVQLTPDSAFVLHDRLCGGPGQAVSPSRGLSDIELAVFQREIIGVFCQLLNDAWDKVEQLDFQLESMESNPQFLQIATDRDVVVVISFTFEFKETEDMVNICIPFRTLEPIINKLTQHRLFDSLKKPDPVKAEVLRRKVRQTHLPLEVELGATTCSVKDLLELKVGDIIQLERNKNENLDIKIGKLTKFKGTPGKLGNKLGVVITSICEPQGERSDE